LISECGTDLSAWPSAKHFTSWLSLAPGNKISGGKILAVPDLGSEAGCGIRGPRSNNLGTSAGALRALARNQRRFDRA
jgi:Transposase IS116/IS110/IS902 family